MLSFRSYGLYALRAIGVFALALYLTRKQLRILCYHSFSLGDEHELDPVMFMRAETFEKRMRILKKRRIPILTLEEAVRKLQEDRIRNAETVVTFDDGWLSNLTVAAPILEKHHYPASIYISTQHLEAGTEVFDVALYYMICRSSQKVLTLQGLHPRLDGTYDIATDPIAATVALINAAELAFSLVERQQLLRRIAQALGADLDTVLRNGRFRLLDRSQVQEAFRRGLDIQLHTHRHRLPDGDFEAMAKEIEQNRKMIADVLGTTACHFCYPSGQYNDKHPQWLRALGIQSATTCNPGLNGADTPVMLLNRFLDSESKSNIIFEAEICGVGDLARRFRLRSASKQGKGH